MPLYWNTFELATLFNALNQHEYSVNYPTKSFIILTMNELRVLCAISLLLMTNVSMAEPNITGEPYTYESDSHQHAGSSINLPDLGDVAQTILSPQQEQQIAEQILEDVYSSDQVLQDIEVLDYIKALGDKLALSSPDQSQDFHFFVVKDDAINAFAMPGGVIGVHTGLITSANNESELASVLGHEIGHVTQRHIARMLASRKHDMFKNIAVTALALLASRSNPQLARGAITAASAYNIQSQLDYSREHEREADRVGLTILHDAGFDTRAMPAFFNTLQRGSQFVSSNIPSYLRTHPLTTERIADVSNRVQAMPYKQVVDKIDFYLVRAKVRAKQGLASDTVLIFEQNVKEKRYRNEVAERYGLALAYLRSNQVGKAEQQMQWIAQHGEAHPNLLNLMTRIKVLKQQYQTALKDYARALKQYPMHRGLIYDYIDLLLKTKQVDKAMQLIQQKMLVFSNDGNLYAFLAKAYGLQGHQLLKHQAQAEAYFRQYNLNMAIEQMDLAAKATDGDFYQRSIVEARLKEFKRLKANKNQNS